MLLLKADDGKVKFSIILSWSVRVGSVALACDMLLWVTECGASEFHTRSRKCSFFVVKHGPAQSGGLVCSYV